MQPEPSPLQARMCKPGSCDPQTSRLDSTRLEQGGRDMLPIRRVARVIVLDSEGSLLLCRYSEPSEHGLRSYWVPPGGALEQREEHRAAAHRELLEETGLDLQIDRELWERRFILQLTDGPFDQIERYFLARLPSRRPAVRNSSSEAIVELRWWTLDELHGTYETIYPEGLESQLRRMESDAGDHGPGGPNPFLLPALPPVHHRVMRPPSRALLHLAEFSPHAPGGFVTHLERLAPAARARGFDPWLGLPTSRTPRPWHERLAQAGWTIRLLRRPWGFRRHYLVDLRSLLRDLDPAVVHIHFHAASLIPVAALTRRDRCLRVMHWHNPARAPRHAVRAADRIARPQHIAVAAYLIEEIGLPPARSRFIPNGVAIPPDEPAPAAGDDLLTISAMRPQKDPGTLLRAIALLAGKGWTGRLRWAGSGPDEASVRAEAASLGVAERIDFLGDVADPSSLFDRSALFVLSSRFEGQPYAALEAMAHARAVVATDLPGVRDLLGEDAARLCVPPGDPQAMMQALRALLDDRSERTEIGRRLRERARQRHSIDGWVAALLEGYEEWGRGLTRTR